MKKEKLNKEGFTLLEMLVVVLIIGILAGIALPQYRKAKEKAEAAQLLILVKALHEAQQRYYLVKGVFATKFDKLDVEIEGFKRGGCEDFSMFTNIDCWSNDKNVMRISSKGISLQRKAGKYKYSGFMFREIPDENRLENKLYCYEYIPNDFCSGLFNCDLIYEANDVNHYYSCKF